MPDLQDALEANDIGTEVPNRFGLVAYGLNANPPNEVIDPIYQTPGPLNFGNPVGHATPRPVPLNPNRIGLNGQPDLTDPYNVYFSSFEPSVDPEPDNAFVSSLEDTIRNWPEVDGETEDSWEAVNYALSVEFASQDPYYHPPSYPPEEEHIYTFREDAVVHFILLTDAGRTRNQEDAPELPYWIPGYGMTSQRYRTNLATLIDKLNRDNETINDDIVLTAFVPAAFKPDDAGLPIYNPSKGAFDPDHPESTNPPILGIDVNAVDGFDVDLLDPIAAYDPDLEPWPWKISESWQSDGNLNDEYVVFYTDGDSTNVPKSERIEGSLLDANKGYEEVIKEFSCVNGTYSHLSSLDQWGDPLPSGDLNPIFDFEQNPLPPDQGLADHAQIDAHIGPYTEGVEEEAFLAWETGGTVWMSSYFASPPLKSTEALLTTLSQEMAKDIANKIASPQVELVTIGSGELPNEETDSYDVPGGSGEQLRTVPVRKADRVTIRFSEEVIVTADDLALESAITGGPDPGAVVVDGFSQVMDRSTGTYTATWIFNEFEPNQIQLALSDDIADLVRNNLDGDWTNPASLGADDTGLQPFPSGNGVRGEPFVFGFTILPGDLNRNNIVGMADWVAMRANYDNYQTTYSFTEGDFNGNGVIDSDDYLYLFKPNAGRIFYFWGDENLLGDVNGDGAVNGVDVAPFIAVLIAGEYDPTADVNDDGNANGVDIGAFVDILLSGGFSAWLNQFGDDPFPGV